jgi:hypothetical protein
VIRYREVFTALQLYFSFFLEMYEADEEKSGS